MRVRGHILFAFLFLIADALLGVARVRAAQPTPIPLPQGQDLKVAEKVGAALWTNCLSQGRQVVLSPDQWTCTDISDGEKLLNDLAPEKFDPATVCGTDDKRLMPTGVLHQIKKMLDTNLNSPTVHTRTIQKIGIRLIGGVYCQDEVNLSDFSLAVPLDLDRSVLKFGFRARNLTIGGNLSFAGSYIYENFDISNGKIGGSLFGRGAFMYQVRITDTEVRDAMRFNDSILLGYFVLAHVTPGRLIDVSRSKISSLSVRQSPIAERLELSNSESACKYQIENSELNEVWAANAGFGTTALPPADKQSSTADKAPPTVYRIWERPFSPSERPGVFPQKILDVKPVKALYSKPTECDDSAAKFSINGGSARSICLQNFYWIEPKANIPAAPTSISFNNVNISGSMAVDLWSSKRTDTDLAVKDFKHRTLEIVGTTIGTLFFDFTDNRRPYVTLIDQIGINRVHTAEFQCTDFPSVTQSPIPDTGQVARWLNKNQARSLQPYVAFIKAFENAGADTTDLKVAKAAYEFKQNFKERRESIGRAWNEKGVIQFLWEDGWRALIDYLSFGAKWILGFIADFGFRPAQVIWSILAIMILSWAIFWLLIRVVAFLPDKKPGMRVVGWIFLFDRLIPLYKLRDENYDISSYYQRGRGEGAQSIRYFGREIMCIPASPRRARIAEIYLDILKVLGIILAAFLVAAVNALIAH
jgi:hypothetical protein